MKYPISTSASNGDYLGDAETAEEATVALQSWLATRGADAPAVEITDATLGATVWNTPLDGKHISDEAWLPVLR